MKVEVEQLCQKMGYDLSREELEMIWPALILNTHRECRHSLNPNNSKKTSNRTKKITDEILEASASTNNSNNNSNSSSGAVTVNDFMDFFVRQSEGTR